MKAIELIVLSLLLYMPSFANAVGVSQLEVDTCAHLDEVVVTGVTGSTRSREIASPVSVVSNAGLRTHQSSNIIDAISRQPGVNQVTTGSGISKPVIRGLGYNRVLVVNDGVRQEGQQWGDEHGIEVDGQAVHSVEILKGPASLMYGSDAMAGVIIMHDAPILPEGCIGGEVGGEYQSNNGLLAYTLNTRGNKSGLVWDGRWSQRVAHDYHAPQDGWIPNSRFLEQALNGMLGVNKKWGSSHLKLGYYHLQPGMTEAEEYGTGSKNYDIEVPYQQVYHYKAVLDNSLRLGGGYLKAIVGYQQNRRQEYEEAGECGLDFRLHTITYDLRFVSPEWRGWKSNWGVNGMWQESENLGDEFLIPAYALNDVGAFVTLSGTCADCLHLSGGLRYDHRGLHSRALEEEGELRFENFRRSYDAISGSLGTIWNVNEQLDLKFNASHGFRAPNMSELGSNGVHEGTFRYEQGNPNLKAEQSWQWDLGLDYAGRYFSTSVALFANRISHYIFLQRAANSIDEVPVYQFTSGDARIMGGEARLILHLLHHLHFENSLTVVDARQLHSTTSQYLPFTPAPRWISTLHYDIPCRSKWMKELFAELEADINFRQNHVMTANDTETPTPAYTLYNINAGANLYLRNGHRLCSVSLHGSNLLDNAYQSHLSRLKYAETWSLTGRSGLNNMGRNLGIKMLFPF